MNELLSKLQRLYGSHPLETDATGRRQALPSEIMRALEMEQLPPEAFSAVVSYFQPTEADIKTKDLGEANK